MRSAECAHEQGVEQHDIRVALVAGKADDDVRTDRAAEVLGTIEGGKAFTASLDLLDRIARALGGRLSVEFEGVRTRAA